MRNLKGWRPNMLKKLYNDSPEEQEAMILHIQEKIDIGPQELMEFIDDMFKNKPKYGKASKLWKTSINKLIDKLNEGYGKTYTRQ